MQTTMKSIITFVLIFCAIGINGTTDENIQLFDQCDQTVGTGVATCLQFFSPFKFVTDFISGNKDSLCCTHFRHNACIQGVRDAVRVAKAANLCPDSITDELITTLSDSTVNHWIIKSCKTFNAHKCVMDSVGDVVNTIQGFFIPQTQQKPVIPQTIGTISNIFNTGNNGANIPQTISYVPNVPNIPNIFSTGSNGKNIPQIINTVPKLFNRGTNGGNGYTVDENYNSNHNYNSDPFREVINPRTGFGPVATTQNPLINKSIRDLFDRQYIPEASDVKPTKQKVDNSKETQSVDPFRSLFSGILNTNNEEVEEYDGEDVGKTSILDSIGNIFASGNNDNKTENGLNFEPIFSDIFGNNDNRNHTIVKDFN